MSPNQSGNGNDAPDIEIIEMDTTDAEDDKDDTHEEQEQPQQVALTWAEIISVNNVMYAKHEEESIHPHSMFGIDLKVKDLRNFIGGTWLEDKVVNHYLEMIKARNNAPNSGLPSVYLFHAEVVKIFFGETGQNGVDYGAVKHAADPDEIFDYDIIFFPIHASSHWNLVAVDLSAKAIIGFDSLGKDMKYYIKGIFHYLRREFAKLRRRERERRAAAAATITSEETSEDSSHSQAIVPAKYDFPEHEFFDEWITCGTDSDAPRQENCNDCGVFTLLFAEYYSRKAEYDFNQTHIKYLRHRLAYETIQGRLLETPPALTRSALANIVCNHRTRSTR